MSRLAVIMALIGVTASLSLCANATAAPTPGSKLGRLTIPSMAISFPLFEGSEVMCQGGTSKTLNKGVAHYPCSALPWEIGTVIVAGHRTTHVAPFRKLTQLKPGDHIKLQTERGTYIYVVQRLKIVSPLVNLDPEPVGRLLLSTCYPAGSDSYRLIVFAKLVKAPREET